MNEFLDRWSTPAAITFVIYSLLGGSLYGVEHYFGGRDAREPDVVEFVVHEVERPPQPPEAEPAPVEPAPPEPEPEPPEPEPEPEPEPPRPEPKRVREAPPAPTPAPPAPQAASELPPSEAEPAPGENLNNDDLAPKRVYRLPDQGPGGTVPVARGRTTGSARGVAGGTGTNTGGGGDPSSTGTGVARPVSVSALKKMPKPIGDQDYRSTEYPDEAKRRGIEGKIKVRLVIDETGEVARATIVSGLGHGLDEQALSFANELRFEPALDQNDRAVTTAIVWTFSFTLPD